MNLIYLDHGATTQPCPEALAAAETMNTVCYGNPSAAHPLGRMAREAVLEAAEVVGGAFGLPGNLCVVFTSGGTEANNMAIFGVCRHKGRIITTQAEHPSVTQAVGELVLRSKNCNWAVDHLPLSPQGHVNPADLDRLVTRETRLLSVAQVNNETGAMQDIAALGKRLKQLNPNALFHVDGVAGFGKHPIPVDNVDMYTLSAHKFYGLKGAGALVVKKSVQNLQPLVFGGGQQEGRRPGTENTPGIAALAAAAKESVAQMDARLAHVTMLKAAFLDGLKAQVPQAVVNGFETLAEGNSPFVANISFVGIPGEVLFNSLQEAGICVSTGASCSTGKKKKNILGAYGLPPERVESALRFCFSHRNTLEEIEITLDVLKEKTAFLRRFIR